MNSNNDAGVRLFTATPVAANFANGNGPPLAWDWTTGALYGLKIDGTVVPVGAAGAAAWGSITGTLSAQTDLQTALDGKQAAGSYATGGGTATGTNTGDNAVNTLYSGLAASKQDTLVSATNIKTVNGYSLLGSGDLVISGGSPKRTVGIVFDGGGSPPTAGSVGYLVCQFTGTIDQWAIVADAAGSAVVDVWKAAGSIPTNGNTIAGSEKPTLSAQQLNGDTSLSTWTTAVTAGDVFGFELESVATCTRITCQVRIAETL